MTALKIVQLYYRCFNNRDWEGMLALLAADVRHETSQGEVREGIALFRAFLAHMDECYEEWLSDFVFFTEPAGMRIAVEFNVHGVYKKTDGDLPPAYDQPYELPAGAFLEVARGKITRVTTFYSFSLWLKQVSV